MRFRKQNKTLKELYPQYSFGRGTYADTNIAIHSWGEGATLEVGSFTSIASGVQIFLGGEHRTDWVTTFPFNVLYEEGKAITGHPKSKGNVEIGSDVWIGVEAMIMSGVNIGDGAVIGARAVVTKNVPPYSIVAGNPAVVVKKRFDDTTIQRLLDIKWWKWEDAMIKSAIPFLLDDEIEKFLEYAERIIVS